MVKSVLGLKHWAWMCSASHDGAVDDEKVDVDDTAPPAAELRCPSMMRGAAAMLAAEPRWGRRCRRSASGRAEVVVDEEGCRRSASGRAEVLSSMPSLCRRPSRGGRRG
jgi:hypothetical protein